MNSEDKIIQYPKSKNKIQCIGPCYEPNTWIIHPITLEYYTNVNDAFCPVYNKILNPETGEYVTKHYDKCSHPTKNTKNINNNDIVLPYIDLDCGLFLRKYYNIYTYEDMVDWLTKNKYKTLRTRNRVVECGWKTYGSDLDIIDQRITEYYLELIKKKWIYKIVDKVNEYIKVDDGKISFGENDKENNKYMTEKINFIIEKFINYDEIYKFILRYIKYRKDKWEIIDNHTSQILKDLIDYIKNKILVTLKS